MTLLLFDIDGTLIRSHGAGRGAMTLAGEDSFGHPNLFGGIDFAGGVDTALVKQALSAAGLEPSNSHVERLRRAYARRLPQTLAKGHGVRCPGVEKVLSRLEGRAWSGLLTGNWSEGARAKLEAYELWRWFEEAPGAFGEDAPRREELLPVAWQRARDRGMHASRVVVIGDTPADVRTARVGAELLGPDAPEVLAVAVRTGFATDESLEASAPDLLLENMEVGLEALLAMVFDERAAR